MNRIFFWLFFHRSLLIGQIPSDNQLVPRFTCYFIHAGGRVNYPRLFATPNDHGEARYYL